MADLRQMFRQSSIYGSADVISKAIAFLLIPVFTRFLDVPDYGRLALFQSLAGVLSVTFLWGTAASLASFYHFKEHRDRFHSIKDTTVRFLLVFNLIVGVGLFWASRLVGINPVLTGLVLIIAYFAVVRTTETVHFVHSGRPGNQLVLVVSFAVVSAVSVIAALFMFSEFDPVNRIFSALAAAGGLFFVIVMVRNRFFMGTPFEGSILREVLIFGLPVLPHALAQWILNFSDRAMLRYFLDYQEVGIYSLGYNFGMMMLIFLSAVNTSWGPAFMGIAENEERASQILTDMAGKIWIAFCLAASGCLLWVHEAITFATPVEYHGAVILSKWIVVSYLIYGSYLLYANGLFAARKSKLVPLATMSAALVNIVLNWFLIPIYGTTGAVIATVVSFTVMAILVYTLASQHYPLGIGPGFLILYGLVPIFVFVVSTTVDGLENMSIRISIKLILTTPLLFYAYGNVRRK